MEETQVASTPALDAVRTEVRDIATNPQNPRHAAYQRSDSQVSAYIDGLYRKAVGTGVVEITGSSRSFSNRQDPGNAGTVGTPAGDALRAEIADIMSNPANPLHEGYKRSDASVMRQIDDKYAKVYGRGTVEIGESVFKSDREVAPRQAEPDPSLSREDRVAQTEVETMLQRTLGDEYEPEMRYMGVGATHLFSIPDGKQVLDAFAPLIADLGPEAEVASVRFMAHLGRLLTARKGA